MINLKNTPPYGLDDLREIMALLRSPDGCLWDREQTHQSIRRNMLEEAYEAAEAIDEGDPEHLKEELGDVLLQVVFHARMAQEAGQFTLDDVIDGVCQKLIYRHPHVFAGEESQDALATWNARKRQEKGQRTTADAMDAVARALPALTRAEKLQKKAGREARLEDALGALLFSAVELGRLAGLDSEQALHKACEGFIRQYRAQEAGENA